MGFWDAWLRVVVGLVGFGLRLTLGFRVSGGCLGFVGVLEFLRFPDFGQGSFRRIKPLSLSPNALNPKPVNPQPLNPKPLYPEPYTRKP